MIAALGAVSPAQFVLSVAIAAALAMAVFAHANKRGNKHATAWGIATFLFAGLALPIYVIWYYWTRQRR